MEEEYELLLQEIIEKESYQQLKILSIMEKYRLMSTL